MRTLIILGFSIIQLCNLNFPLMAQNAIARVNVNEITTKHVNVRNDKAERKFTIPNGLKKKMASGQNLLKRISAIWLTTTRRATG